MAKKKRKICFVITSFIHYSRNLLVLEELKKRSDVDLHVIIAGTALLSKYSSKHAHIKENLLKDGFKNLYEIHFNLEGSEPTTKAKTAGLGVIEFSSFYNQIKPDVVVVRGDRFEVLAATTAASLMGLPVAHIEGGDVSGSIDESIRHAVTKLSNIHFATNEDSKQRLLSMGENPKYVFNFGSPDIEMAIKFANGRGNTIDVSKTGSGGSVDRKGDFLVVFYHPVTTELHNIKKNTQTLIDSIHELGIPTIWFWPNFDTGAEEISQVLRSFNDNVIGHKIRFMRYLPPKEFLSILNTSTCLVGNSSSGIKECSYLGVPVVNIGTRQAKRLRGKNLIDIGHDKNAIKRAIKKQLKHGKYNVDQTYHKNGTSKNIAQKLACVPLHTQKNFHG